MPTARESLVTLLTGKFEVPPADIRDEALLSELGLDSLAAAELHVTLKDQHHAQDRTGEISEKLTLREAVDVLASWLPEPSAGPVRAADRTQATP